MDQEQSPAGGGTMVQGQLVWTALKSKSGSFVLNLPDQPEGTLNPSHPQTFGWVSVVAMAHGIDQGFMEAQFQLRLELPAGHRFEQQLHEGSQLESRWRDEI